MLPMPHIAYMVGDALTYATNRSGEWTFVKVDSVLGLMRPSLGIDENGVVHIAYVGAADDLRHATNAQNAWQIETLEQENSSSPSLALDLGGAVHVAYLGEVDSTLRTISNASGVWLRETVDDRFPGTGLTPSLALDEVWSRWPCRSASLAVLAWEPF
jgi:hypothetical protein